VKNPVILSKSQPLIQTLSAIIALMIACGGMLVFCQNLCFTRTEFLERVFFLTAAIMAAYYGLNGGFAVLIAAILLFCILIIVQWRKRWHVLGPTTEI
jgi:hypothetical protein